MPATAFPCDHPRGQLGGMFVMLFGLSMDYHIFILSRIRERRASTADPCDAIVDGIGASAGVVTSAAAITSPASKPK